MSLEHDKQHQNADQESEFLEDSESRLRTFPMALVRGWGMIFRAIFITIIGIVAYFWLDPQSIGDVPLSQLTLNHIFSNLFSVLIFIGCIIWFFNFPDQANKKSSKDNPYFLWGQFGGAVVLVIALVLYWLLSKE